MKKELTIGSNGYYFIDNVRVEKEDWDRELLQQQLDRIEKKMDKLIDKIILTI